MMWMINESKFFHRRADLNRVKDSLKTYAKQVFYETKSYKQFKYELTLKCVESVIYQDYELGWEDLPEKEEIEFVTDVSNLFEDIIKGLYKDYSK